jgi:hypothetical protein
MATWTFLQTQYHIRESIQWCTLISIPSDRVPPLLGVKGIAQAITHFDAILDKILPLSAKTGSSMSSNLGQRSLLQQTNRTQLQSIDAVADAAVFIWRHQIRASGSLWIFSGMNLAHRKPPRFMLARDVIEWAEFAIPFVQASIVCHSAECLVHFAPTYEGLREFMTRKKMPLGADIFAKHDSLKSRTKAKAKEKAELEAKSKAESEAKMRAELEAKLKAEVEVDLEAELLRRGGRVKRRDKDKVRDRDKFRK